jgi:hypothetical protein
MQRYMKYKTMEHGKISMRGRANKLLPNCKI